MTATNAEPTMAAMGRGRKRGPLLANPADEVWLRLMLPKMLSRMFMIDLVPLESRARSHARGESPSRSP